MLTINMSVHIRVAYTYAFLSRVTPSSIFHMTSIQVNEKKEIMHVPEVVAPKSLHPGCVPEPHGFLYKLVYARINLDKTE